MTNSSSSSQVPKLVFIHGLNNNQSCLELLIEHFRGLGFEVMQVHLPGNGDDRYTAKTQEDAMKLFTKSMATIAGPFHAIAFSTGALFLQLWLETHPAHALQKQVLLAPAFAIRRQNVFEWALKLAPRHLLIKSFSPKAFRKHEFLWAWEYDVLLKSVLHWQKLRRTFRVPTKIFIDREDELVDSQRLEQTYKETVILDRPGLEGLGAHHILFHPRYFTEETWAALLKETEEFLKQGEALSAGA